MDKNSINRINELAKKKREQGLTEAETQEQKKLYKDYINSMKKNFVQQINNIDIETPDGKVTPLSDFEKNK